MGTAIGLSNAIGFGKKFSWSSYWTTRHPELATYIAGLTTPLSEAQIIRLGEFIEALKTGLSITNLSDAFDLMYVLGGETSESSLRNIVSSSYHAVAVNSPAFTQYEGFKGNATSSYIDTNFIISDNASAYTLDDASAGVYIRENVQGSKYIFGVSNLALPASRLWLLPNRGSGSRYWNINSDLGVISTDVTTAGMFSITRTASNVTDGYYNDTNPVNLTTASNRLPNAYKLFLLCHNNGNNGATAFSDSQISLFFLGKGFTQTQINTITSAIEAYMDANGKGVIA